MIKPALCYIGRRADRAKHFAELLGEKVSHFPDITAAAKAKLKGPLTVLWDKTDMQRDIQMLRLLAKKYNPLHVILLTDTLNDEERKAYRSAGVNSALTPDTDRESLLAAIRVLDDSRAGDDAQAYAEQSMQIRRIPLGKRLFDIASAAALIMLSPLLLAVAAAIRLESKGPIIYRSKRVGSNYKVFDFLKFRSMYTAADLALKELNKLNQYTAEEPETDASFPGAGTAHMGGAMLISDDCIIPEEAYISQVATEQKNTFVKLENDPRVTRVGRFIRKYSIDELPQLINILRGDMSVVGNRPLPLYEAEQLTSDEYIDRFMCPAGLTGLWQVEKRGEAGKLSAEERKQLDIQYAKNYSPQMDLRIILKTFMAFVQKENV